MDFLLGCNYWASNAGADMWREFDIQTIKKDLQLLSSHGVKVLRVFPNWRDFQPVMPVYRGKNNFVKYILEGDKDPQNEYYLDNDMLDKFGLFLDECQAVGVNVIVGLITGFMSGRLYTPSALYGKNLITDQTALYFEQLFIKGFVKTFKNRQVISAWDLGNECNNLSPVTDRYQAANWVATISNAIRAEDSSRLIVSGMHELSVEGLWTINDQARFTDVLTTHPYPFWCDHTRIDKTMSFRTTIHPTAQTKYYSEIGKKPCLAEEIGTMGPSVCSEENAADFLRINILSLLANGCKGVLWWCAFEQNKLENFPYAIEMVERELGMVDGSYQPKPVLKEMKKLQELIQNKDITLTQAKTDAVCLLSKEQRQWGVGYMTYGLLKTVGLNCSFEFVDNPLPDADVYLLPSIQENHIIEKRAYERLLQKVHNGATLYVSTDNAVLSGFEKFTGLKIIDSFVHPVNQSVTVMGKNLQYTKDRSILITPTTATVLLNDLNGNPLLTVNEYGKGKVYYLNFSLEDYLIDKENAFDKDYDQIYKTVFSDLIDKQPIKINDKKVVYTVHPDGDNLIIVALNHSDQNITSVISINNAYAFDKVLYGDINNILPWDGVIFSIKKN